MCRWVVSAVALCATNAWAIPMSYEFTATIDGADPLVAQLLSVAVGDTIHGGFTFDSEAERTSLFQCYDCNHDGGRLVPGAKTIATYDMSSLSLWLAVASWTFTGTGETLMIQDVPDAAYDSDSWHLDTRATPQEIGAGLFASAILFRFDDWYDGPLTSADLQVPLGYWGPQESYINTRLLIRFNDSIGIGSEVTSITSVPEPGTLALMGAGLLGALLASRRRRGHGAAEHG
jgi:hypothetical protein